MSVEMDALLPKSENLNISALSGLFNQTTNSYKFIFFISLIELLKERNFSTNEPFSFLDITVEMLATAWYPHVFFKLSFGAQDTLAKKLDQLDISSSSSDVAVTSPNKSLLRKSIKSGNLGEALRLMRYVPYRLLNPFLEQEVRLIDKGAGTKFEYRAPSIVNRCFCSQKPLYKFDSDDYRKCSKLFVHPEWASYFEEHYSIISGWAAWNWLHYMQKRNPATPGISRKLFIPQAKGPLNTQRQYWREVLQAGESKFKCIYSDNLLKSDCFSLDHYLPWSFVVHDQLWNLVPILPRVNSAKSNNIPSNKYFDKLVDLQHHGLLVAKEIFTEKKFKKTTESFIVDLNVHRIEDMFDYKVLYDCYMKTVEPLKTLAANQGFSKDWEFKD